MRQAWLAPPPRDLKLTFEDPWGHGEIERDATLLEVSDEENLLERGTRPLGEAVATFSTPRVLGQLVDEPPEMAPVLDRDLQRLIHHRQRRTLAPASGATYPPCAIGG